MSKVKGMLSKIASFVLFVEIILIIGAVVGWQITIKHNQMFKSVDEIQKERSISEIDKEEKIGDIIPPVHYVHVRKNNI